MPTTITTDHDLDELRRVANRLYRRRPCVSRVSCIAAERERKLTQEERCRFPQWEQRPYDNLDPLRMCTACLRFWLIERAARLEEEPPGIVTEEREEERPKLPQKG